MTVKMASGTIFGGVLHFFLVAVVLVSFANSMSSVLPLVLNTWPCTDATEEKESVLHSVILILALPLPLVQPHR